MELASYESTKGLLVHPTSIDSLIKIQEETRLRFCQFKQMVRNGECTIQELEQMVINKYGPIHKASDITLQETIETYPVNDKYIYDYDSLTNILLSALSGDVKASSGKKDESLAEEVDAKPVKKISIKKNTRKIKQSEGKLQ